MPLEQGGVEARIIDAGGDEVMSTTKDRRAFAGAPSMAPVLDGIDGRPVAHLVVAVSDRELERRLSEVALITGGLSRRSR